MQHTGIVKYLLDTQILLWASTDSKRLSAGARKILADLDHQLFFSAASLWEIAIKTGVRRPDFDVDPRLFRRGLLDNGYAELAITSEHAVATELLPDIHRDPFDRMLVAQAIAEGMALLTGDATVARYPGSIQKV